MRWIKRVISYWHIQHLCSVTVFVFKCIQKLPEVSFLGGIEDGVGEMQKPPSDLKLEI